VKVVDIDFKKTSGECCRYWF